MEHWAALKQNKEAFYYWHGTIAKNYTKWEEKTRMVYTVSSIV